MLTALLVIVGVVILGLIGVVVYAGWRLWRDAEIAKAEHEAMRRRILAAAHRVPRPLHEKAAQGFEKRGNGRIAS